MYSLTAVFTLQHATRRLGISTPRTYRAAREAFTRFLHGKVRRLAGGHEAGVVVGAYTIFLAGAKDLLAGVNKKRWGSSRRGKCYVFHSDVSSIERLEPRASRRKSEASNGQRGTFHD
jgi:hypothetical protein